MKYNVHEIFPSVQAEGLRSGTPSVFIRLAGCDRSCSFCDTDHTTRQVMTAQEILAEVQKYKPIMSTVLTGGEPTFQDVSPLLYLLRSSGYYNAVETNGLYHTRISLADFVTFSPKDERINDTPANEVKIVWGTVDPRRFNHYAYKFIQPMDCKNIFKTAASIKEALEYCLRNPEWRLSVQWHKLLNIK